MNKEKAYDLPTRLFHWLFAGLFVAAFAIAKLTDDESPRFSQHMLLGMILFATTALRVVWGLLGSRYARFSSFLLHPASLVRYFREFLSPRARSYFAHNPASAWAAVVMMALALGLGATGYLMATGNKETFEDIHELLANAFAITALAHVAGVVLHTIRHRDAIALSMIHGRKENKEGAPAITSSYPIVALVMAGLIGAFALHVYGNYNAKQGTTSVFGTKLQLGENEQEHDDD